MSASQFQELRAPVEAPKQDAPPSELCNSLETFTPNPAFCSSSFAQPSLSAPSLAIKRRFFAARLGIEDWETAGLADEPASFFHTSYTSVTPESQNPSCIPAAVPEAEWRSIPAPLIHSSTTSSTPSVPDLRRSYPTAEHQSTVPDGGRQPSQAVEENSLLVSSTNRSGPLQSHSFPPRQAQDEERPPSLADRLAATLHSIQGCGPARKLPRSSINPETQRQEQMRLQNALLANSFEGALTPSYHTSDILGRTNHFPSQALQQSSSHSTRSKTGSNEPSLQGPALSLISQIILLQARSGMAPGVPFRNFQTSLLSPQVPRTLGGSQKEAVRGFLVRAAEAAERKDMAAFKALSQQLKPHSRRRGKGFERTSFLLLQALKHRLEGTAGTVVKRRLHITVQEMEKIKAWYYMAMPVCSFTAVVSVRVLLHALRGHPCVHLVVFGDSFMPQLARFITLLGEASSSSSVVQGRALQPLMSIRVTQVRGIGLARPGRTEFETLQASDAISSRAREVAKSLGVKFSFHGIILREQSLCLFDEIQRRPGEALAVCSISELKYFSEDLGEFGDSLFKFMQCIRGLQPEVVCMIEEDVDASGAEFMPRFLNTSELLAMAHDAHDSLVVSSDPRYIHGFEDYYWNLIAFNIIGCEGSERRWRIRSFRDLSELFLSWGFKPAPIDLSVVSAVQDKLFLYSEGWGLSYSAHRLNITWQGVVAHAASAWCLPCAP